MSAFGGYGFGQMSVSQLIDDAYERIGILPDLITAQQIQSAQSSANFILSEWINRGLNLWTVGKIIASIVPNQAVYSLSPEAIDILEMVIRQSVRMLGGTAFASEGTAGNAFDGNPNTACEQENPDGNIWYQFSSPSIVQMVGVQSNVDANYTLDFQYSDDNKTWKSAFLSQKINYPKGLAVWFEMPIPTRASYFGILETGGAILNIQELYFERVQTDMAVTPISREDYMFIPNKQSPGRPSCYYVNRQLNPTFALWLVPGNQYKTIVYTFKKYMQDVGVMTNSIDIPQRFYEALCSELAAKLANKLKPQLYEALSQKASEAFDKAAREDVEKYVPLTLNFDCSQWSNF